LNGKLELPRSREYQKKEIENIILAFNEMLDVIRKGDHVAGIPLRPETADELHRI
jgi:hypothetical protein